MIRRPTPDLRAMALRAAALALAAATLAGCNMLTRMSEVGEAPKISSIQNPTQSQAYRPVSMPMPHPVQGQPSANSLWRPGSRAFFKDQRAAEVGDILTVSVKIDDKAEMSNKTTQARDASESAGMPNLLGIEGSLARVLPEAVDPSALIGLDSSHGTSGTGALDRTETIAVNLAAVIIQILPNGNLVIAGRQEVRVNYELRELTVTGVIRPEDISSSNIVTSEKIAEARISYGGRGSLSDLQQPRYGQQLFDIIFPF